MRKVKTLREIAELIHPHVEARTMYVRSLPKDVRHLDLGRMILGDRLSRIVEGDHRPFDLVELLDVVIASVAHFAVGKGTTWGLSGPQLVPEGPADTRCIHDVALKHPCPECEREHPGARVPSIMEQEPNGERLGELFPPEASHGEG